MIEIRPGRDDDKTQILELINDVFGAEQAERAEKRWQWQWHDNPLLEKPGYNGVVAEWDGRVIGNLSCVPAGLHIDGQPVLAYWYTDALVHWGHLRRALKAQKRSGESAAGPDLSNGIAAAMLNHPAAGHRQLGKHVADAMAAIGLRIGFTALRETDSWSRIISFRQPLEGIVGKFLAAPLGAVADLFLARIPKPALEVTLLAGDFDAQFDDLWDTAKREYTAITRRDRASLNWRYRQHPDTDYTILTTTEQGRLSGYLVYSIFFRHRQRRAYIVDILAQKEKPAVYTALIAAALQQMRREGVHKVECYTASTAFTAELKSLGFTPKLNRGTGQATLIRNLPVMDFYITRGDGDGG